MAEAVIQTDKLTKHFASFTAVDEISFSVAAGEIFGFLGANGEGKTTAMKMLTALLAPTSGVPPSPDSTCIARPIRSSATSAT
jgi:ABC-2 type transport system ATP-binding protein